MQALLLVVLIFASVVQGRTINILRQPEQARACFLACMQGTPSLYVPTLRCVCTSLCLRHWLEVHASEAIMLQPVFADQLEACFFLSCPRTQRRLPRHAWGNKAGCLSDKR